MLEKVEKEYIRKAAQAAGYPLGVWNGEFKGYWLQREKRYFNPFREDADAFRLQIDLGIRLAIDKKKNEAYASHTQLPIGVYQYGMDYRYAARHAITCVAALLRGRAS